MARFHIEVRELKPFDVEVEELVTLTEAARMLGVSTSAMGDLVYRGVLRRVVDTAEANPTKANRVLREELLAELARRRGRRDDGRLKVKRGRPAREAERSVSSG